MTHHCSRRGIVGLAWLALFWIGCAGASGEYNTTADGVMLHGYDPVSYFLPDGPEPGSSRYQGKHDGVTYRFANADNRAKFLRKPGRYVPAFGGYCSYGVRVGQKFDIDPDAWKIVDDTLYLQLDQGTQRVWLQNPDKNIEIAMRLWPQIQHVPAEQLSE